VTSQKTPFFIVTAVKASNLRRRGFVALTAFMLVAFINYPDVALQD
jgi:hypothetical protein